MRTLTGVGTPRSLQGHLAALCRALWAACRTLIGTLDPIIAILIRPAAIAPTPHHQAAAA
jgi:hypothetical protein